MNTRNRNFRIADDLYDAALLKAKAKGDSLTDIVRKALESYVSAEDDRTLEEVIEEMEKRESALRTADKYEITDGMRVWDYNLERGTVDLSTIDSDGWFYVVNDNGGRSLMNWERVCVAHPFTREVA